MPPIVPVKGEMIALTKAAIPNHMIWGNGLYVVPRGGYLLVGATVTREGFDSAPTDAAADWLVDQAVALMPALRVWELVKHWAGLRPGSPDDLPLIGSSPLGALFIASGQFRNGILLAPAIAEAVTSMVLGQPPREDLSAFDPRRFVAGY
jgi:glycine/D-amino acid oxidase-like deaminating enzyme